MKVVASLAAPTPWVDPQDVASKKKGMGAENSVNATKISIAPESKEEIIERHHKLKEEDTTNVETQWSETMHRSKKYNSWTPNFTIRIQKSMSM